MFCHDGRHITKDVQLATMAQTNQKVTSSSPNPSVRPDTISVEQVGLTFTNGFVGLKATSLEIAGGTFCTLLGPSGSGKTTLLRAIAGLITPTSGRIFIGGKDVTDLPVQARNVGFVFQNYALFPHMSVAENIEYPLKLHKWDLDSRRKRVDEILSLIELKHAAGRAVGELSGGQQQRVAIGRALSYKPSLLLLDEPMGALDRRLRQQLGAQLREIQQQTGITAVYVTHDQEEAFILSDNIAIMNHGEILQFDTPKSLYFQPRTRFVAQFLGEANLIDVSAVEERSSGVMSASTAVGEIPVTRGVAPGERQAGLVLAIRPEDVVLTEQQDMGGDFIQALPVTFEKELFLGSRCLTTIRDASGKEMLVESSKSHAEAKGRTLWMAWKQSAAVLVNG